MVGILFLLHQLLQRGLGIDVPFVNDYFDPFACAILGLTALRWERQHLWHDRKVALRWYEIVLATLFLAVVSEELFSRLSDSFYHDPYDYLAFAIGAVFYTLVINRFKGEVR